MTERRPHWDDALIEAVKDNISGYCFDHVEGPLYDEDVYPVIAAVEDWMDANDNPLPHVLNECLQWLDAERAAIARVRELHLPCTAFSVQEGGCGPGEHTVSDPPVCFHCQAAWPCPTVKALDGGKASRREPRRAETTTSEQERLI